jgi:SsrA-binding protein
MTTFIRHRKARFDYEILDTFEAGIVLSGSEVKSIRAGKGKLEGAYIRIYDSVPTLLGASVSPYQVANTPANYEPERPRTLLLKAKEIATLERETHANRLTIVPLSFYNKNGKIKLSVALARGKKKADKRETLKQRAVKRDIDRTLKGI